VTTHHPEPPRCPCGNPGDAGDAISGPRCAACRAECDELIDAALRVIARRIAAMEAVDKADAAQEDPAMTLSACRSMQPHRPKGYEAEGTAVREEDRQAECPKCRGEGVDWSRWPPQAAGPIEPPPCPDCDGFGRVWPDDEFDVVVVQGANSRRFGPLSEAEARRACEQTAESGMPAVLLRRDGDGWAEVERFAAAPQSPRLVPVKARPYSSWRR
jgi:hypothetical protein